MNDLPSHDVTVEQVPVRNGDSEATAWRAELTEEDSVRAGGSTPGEAVDVLIDTVNGGRFSMSVYYERIEVDLRDWDLPDDVDLPGAIDVEGEIAISTGSERLHDNAHELAIAAEVGLEDALASTLRKQGHTVQDGDSA
jgi:hypothetical protein